MPLTAHRTTIANLLPGRSDPHTQPFETAEQAWLWTMAALIARRRQLIEMLGAEQRRLPQATTSAVRRDLRHHIRWLERRLTDVDDDIRGAVETSPVWRVQEDLLRRVPGIGPIGAHTLLAACLSSDSSIDERSPPSSASRRSIATAADGPDGDRSGAVAARFGPRCTWRRSSPRVGIVRSPISIGTSVTSANRRKSP